MSEPKKNNLANTSTSSASTSPIHLKDTKSLSSEQRTQKVTTQSSELSKDKYDEIDKQKSLEYVFNTILKQWNKFVEKHNKLTGDKMSTVFNCIKNGNYYVDDGDKDNIEILNQETWVKREEYYLKENGADSRIKQLEKLKDIIASYYNQDEAKTFKSILQDALNSSDWKLLLKGFKVYIELLISYYDFFESLSSNLPENLNVSPNGAVTTGSMEDSVNKYNEFVQKLNNLIDENGESKIRAAFGMMEGKSENLNIKSWVTKAKKVDIKSFQILEIIENLSSELSTYFQNDYMKKIFGEDKNSPIAVLHKLVTECNTTLNKLENKLTLVKNQQAKIPPNFQAPKPPSEGLNQIVRNYNKFVKEYRNLLNLSSEKVVVFLYRVLESYKNTSVEYNVYGWKSIHSSKEDFQNQNDINAKLKGLADEFLGYLNFQSGAYENYKSRIENAINKEDYQTVTKLLGEIVEWLCQMYNWIVQNIDKELGGIAPVPKCGSTSGNSTRLLPLPPSKKSNVSPNSVTVPPISEQNLLLMPKESAAVKENIVELEKFKGKLDAFIKKHDEFAEKIGKLNDQELEKEMLKVLKPQSVYDPQNVYNVERLRISWFLKLEEQSYEECNMKTLLAEYEKSLNTAKAGGSLRDCMYAWEYMVQIMAAILPSDELANEYITEINNIVNNIEGVYKGKHNDVSTAVNTVVENLESIQEKAEEMLSVLNKLMRDLLKEFNKVYKNKNNKLELKDILVEKKCTLESFVSKFESFLKGYETFREGSVIYDFYDNGYFVEHAKSIIYEVFKLKENLEEVKNNIWCAENYKDLIKDIRSKIEIVRKHLNGEEYELDVCMSDWSMLLNLLLHFIPKDKQDEYAAALNTILQKGSDAKNIAEKDEAIQKERALARQILRYMNNVLHRLTEELNAITNKNKEENKEPELANFLERETDKQGEGINKNVKKCFKEAFEVFVDCIKSGKAESVNVQNVISKFSSIGDKKFKTALSIALKDGKLSTWNNDISKSAMGVLFISMAYFKNSKDVVNACKGLKEGGLNSSASTSNDFLGNCFTVRKGIKNYVGPKCTGENLILAVYNDSRYAKAFKQFIPEKDHVKGIIKIFKRSLLGHAAHTIAKKTKKFFGIGKSKK